MNINQKQVVYSKFSARMMAAGIDMFLFMMVMIPILSFTQPFIYHSKTSPQEILEKSMVEAYEKFPDNALERLKYLRDDSSLTQSMFQDNYVIFVTIAINVLELLLFILACFISWKFIQSSPGKLLFALKIVDRESLGKPTTKQLAIRALACLLSSITLGSGFIWIMFNKEGKALHDILSKTVVIKM